MRGQSILRKTDKRALRALVEAPTKPPRAALQAIENLPTLPEPVLSLPISSLVLARPSEPAPPSTSTSTASFTDHSSGKGAETLNEKASYDNLGPDVDVLEKGHIWDGYQEDALPEKTQGKKARNLRHIIFTLYRRQFGIVFVINLAILIATIAEGGLDSPGIGKIVTGNLFIAILMRQDYVINAFFKVFCSVPPRYSCFLSIYFIPSRLYLTLLRSWPLFIRRICARVYHIGGCEYIPFL